MKTPRLPAVILALVVACLAPGCLSRQTVTLANGDQIQSFAIGGRGHVVIGPQTGLAYNNEASFEDATDLARTGFGAWAGVRAGEQLFGWLGKRTTAEAATAAAQIAADTDIATATIEADKVIEAQRLANQAVLAAP